MNPRLDLAAFKNDPGLVTNASELFHTALYQKMMTVAYNHRPRGYPQRGQPVNKTQALIELGRMQGYEDCLTVFEAMTWTVPSDEVTNQTPWDYDNLETETNQ